MKTAGRGTKTKTKAKGFRYESQRLLQVAMPMGGVGAGCICLNGYGGLQDFSIRNVPSVTALPDGHSQVREAAFGLLHIKGDRPVTRLIEGPMPPEKLYDQALQAQGYRHGGHEGMPRFREATFEAEYPFGHVELADPKVPLAVRVTGFSPFIPRDDRSSGMPCAILEYTFHNPTRRMVSFEFSYHLSHMAVGKTNKLKGTRTRAIPRRGVFFYNDEASHSESFGTLCLLALKGDVAVKGMWFRGGWFDAIGALWTEVSTGRFKGNAGSDTLSLNAGNGGSILFKASLAPGKTVTFPLAIAWHFPNSYLAVGQPPCEPESGCCKAEAEGPAWRPYYAGVWGDALAVAQEVRSQYASLRRRTEAFKDALFGGTLPREILDAVSANLAILKSPTVLRQENGNVWGWEGCFTTAGCCHGSCTHVWNYAQAMCHLFPALERTLRVQELVRSMDERGHVSFRSALPDGPAGHGYHAAADGQLGGILKLWRDWHISGDTDWMRSLYPLAKKSLEYGMETWDPRRAGALAEPHHNTYDIEFWGPDGMCTSIYIGALSAMAEMAEAVGEAAAAEEYRRLAGKGAAFMERELFNGEYYQQKVQYKDLRDQSFNKLVAEGSSDGNQEAIDLQRREGPKYQYGSGCLSDGVIGAWMAELYGVATPMNPRHVRSSLKAIFQHNFRDDLFEHANLQRPGYALGNEPGLLLCSWPRGGKPTLPFVYSDEVWTGIEYQVASHLLLHGLVDEARTIIKGARSRYDGRVRNPFNEYECGSYYARAMASYALLQSYSGFRYSALTRRLDLAPRTRVLPFVTFYCTAEGFGVLRLDKKSLTVTVIEGKLLLREVAVGFGKKTCRGEVDAVVRAGRPQRFELERLRSA